jgi:phospholipid/cholesterol/gamma-HCH transport system permease protein
MRLGIGGAAIPRLRAWGHAARFAALAMAAALSPSTYDAATREVALRQIHYTALQVWAAFILFSALFSILVIDITLRAAREFGLVHYALELVFRVLVLELIPLFTALFVALRSGAAINTAVALMQRSGELARLQAAGVDPLRREFAPRVAAAAISVLCLTVISCVVALGLAYVRRYGFSPWGFEEYTRTVALVFNPPALAGFAIKCLAFGVVVAVIPIAAGMEEAGRTRSAPAAVMSGMMWLFLGLALIETAALSVKYV